MKSKNVKRVIANKIKGTTEPLSTLMTVLAFRVHLAKIVLPREGAAGLISNYVAEKSCGLLECGTLHILFLKH